MAFQASKVYPHPSTTLAPTTRPPNRGMGVAGCRADFNYDGVTKVFDLVGINTATAYGQGTYLTVAAAASSGILNAVAVPEPWATLPGCPLARPPVVIGRSGTRLAACRIQRTSWRTT
jgi:hypothetical protein